MDAENYAYPIKSIPWDPSEATDPRLAALRDERGYSYADVLTIHPDHLPNFDTHVKNFFTEHIHDAEEIRYILGGSGYVSYNICQMSTLRFSGRCLSWPLSFFLLIFRSIYHLTTFLFVCLVVGQYLLMILYIDFLMSVIRVMPGFVST